MSNANAFQIGVIVSQVIAMSVCFQMGPDKTLWTLMAVATAFVAGMSVYYDADRARQRPKSQKRNTGRAANGMSRYY